MKGETRGNRGREEKRGGEEGKWGRRSEVGKGEEGKRGWGVKYGDQRYRETQNTKLKNENNSP